LLAVHVGDGEERKQILSRAGGVACIVEHRVGEAEGVEQLVCDEATVLFK